MDTATWTIDFTRKAEKQKGKLPEAVAATLDLLVGELAFEGPEQPEWHHYGKLAGKKNVYHCHLNKGRPRYVAVWKVTDEHRLTLEVIYAGTHENANYRRLG